MINLIASNSFFSNKSMLVILTQIVKTLQKY